MQHDHPARHRGSSRLPFPGRFQRRPPMSILPLGLQRDLRAFFGSYSQACRQADDLLSRPARPNSSTKPAGTRRSASCYPMRCISTACALENLSPLLRVYEGCARAYLGEIDGANLIKLHRQSGKVSYLTYPEFETHPHPALLRSIKLSLRTREIDCLEYRASTNPPILHRKETFLAPDHPLHAKFARLTQQEKTRPPRRHGNHRHPRRLAGQADRRGLCTSWASTGPAQITG